MIPGMAIMIQIGVVEALYMTKHLQSFHEVHESAPTDSPAR